MIKFGLALAGALLSKFSSGLLFFVFIAYALSLRCKRLPEQPVEKIELRHWRRRAWRNLAMGTLWAGLFVYIVYFVLSWNQPTDSFRLIPHFPASLVFRRLLMPVWLYLRGLVLFALSAGSRPTFILGHAYSHGVWFYFPRALPPEITADISLAAPSCGRGGFAGKASFTQAISNTHWHGAALAQHLDFVWLFSSQPAC